MATPCRMLKEAREAPDRVADLLTNNKAAYRDLASRLRERDPSFIATVARGSSDHAASFGASVFAQTCNKITASLSPSLVSRYGLDLDFKACFALAISQSGASPDLVACLAAARDGGAVTAALVNVEGSALASKAAHVLPQQAGEEQAVAATKSFICSLASLAWLAAHWSNDDELIADFAQLPKRLEAALRCDWSPAIELFADAQRGFVIGRGPCLGIAQESALKLKEVAALQAEAFSPAEVQHGPRAVIAADVPVLAYGLDDAGGQDTAKFAQEMRLRGARIASASPHSKADLPLPPPLHPCLDPIVAIQAFYPFVAELALARGLDPDRPSGLSKVTRTV